jgi:hypothetical protein
MITLLVGHNINKEIEMANKTYTVKGNRTAADVVVGREEIVETGYTLEEAKIAAIQVQRTGEFVAAWIEEEEAKASDLRIVKNRAQILYFKLIYGGSASQFEVMSYKC